MEKIGDIYAVDALNEESTPSSFDFVQRQELEFLNLLYQKDLKILVSTFPYKFQVSITPFFEQGSLVFPNGCPEYNVILLVEYSEKYPLYNPVLRPHSNTRELIKNQFMYDLTEKMKAGVKNEGKGPFISTLVERVRSFLLEKLRKDFGGSKKIRHFMDKEVSEDEVEVKGQFDGMENLSKKATQTTLTRENFAEWLRNFNAEMKSLEKKKKMLEKPTGKQIFQMSSGGLFIDEGEVKEDEEDAEWDQAAEEAEESEDSVEVEEGLFEGEAGDIEELPELEEN